MDYNGGGEKPNGESFSLDKVGKYLFTQNNLSAVCGNPSYSKARWQTKIRVGTALPVWQLVSSHTHILKY
jgi:hypothetical protein